MRTLVIVVAVLVAACDSRPFQAQPQADWEKAPREYTCTTDQMQRVERETKWCDQNTSYLKTYCYGSAFIRNCTKIETKP